MQPSDAVLKFLASIGGRSEIELYLKLFRSQEPDRFAILSVDEQVDREALELDLHYLEALDLHAHVASSSDDLAALATERRARKLIFLGPWRGLEPAGRAIPSQIDLTTEYDELAPLLSDEHRAILVEARRIIDTAEHAITIAVTSPLELLRELFTVRGAGTMIRRGAVVSRFDSFAAADPGRLTAVIESAFGTAPPSDFFSRHVAGVYVAGDYAGAAIVSTSELGPYLNKFAVDRRAQGEGIGRDLWRAIATDCPTLFWRSRGDNPITGWYLQQCEGLIRIDGWHVFWRGLEPAQIPRAIELALAAPDDFPR